MAAVMAHSAPVHTATIQDMDIDMDIDLAPAGELENFEIDIDGTGALTAEMIQPEEAATTTEPSEHLQPTKVYVRGLDDLTTEDIKSFVSEHYSDPSFQRVEWIDDSSANLCFTEEAVASRALEALSNYPPDFSTALPRDDLREAKGFLRRPEANLQIRIAFATDKKQAKAHEASRFYLMHPEEDPRERRRRENRHDLRRRRQDDNRRRRRKSDEEVEKFDASMYDDDAGALAQRITGRVSRRTSGSWEAGSSSEVEGRGKRRQVDSYRPRSSRDRSASPGRDDKRVRRRTPPPAYSAKDPFPTPAGNASKELFSSRKGIVSEKNNGSRELFPNKSAAASVKKELFPTKKTSSHRRSDAFDAADETADLFANRLAVASATSGMKQSNGILSQSSSNRAATRTESDRNGRLSPDAEGGISVRGASNHGVSIRGFAEDSTKELFPNKMSNIGKELFGEKIKGRGGKRNRAEDMFG